MVKKIESRQVKRRLAREAAKDATRKLSPFSGLNRRYRRHEHDTKNDVINNRKKTRGRDIYYQIIPLIEKRKVKEGKSIEHILIGLNTIRHIRPSQTFIRIQQILINQSLKRKG